MYHGHHPFYPNNHPLSQTLLHCPRLPSLCLCITRALYSVIHGYKSPFSIVTVKAVVQSGMFVAVSAGNEFGDARDVSPASEPSVCTVGATTINDTIAEFSNTGPVVDILAPGVDVLSTWNNGSTAVISGTSMSAPHVAGLGAYLLGAGLAEVESLCETIKGLALKNVIMLLPNGTANLLANNGVDQDGERQPQDPKPTYGLH
ncbi:hypothetical protein HBI16_166840 [Parastagonospora nodorum]|nr:hypothetical protein HBI16_166840 [Parastagonospora nodorum]